MSQFNKYVEFLKGLFKSKNKKKLVENAVIVIIIGVVILIAASSFFKKNNDENDKTLSDNNTASVTVGKTINSDDKSQLEKDVEEILAKINGAGKVNVMITFIGGKELITAYDTKVNENNTQEKDSGGGTRSVIQNDTEKKVVFEEGEGGVKKPIITKELMPEVKGVVVVADGASDPQVKDCLMRAAQTLLDVSIHKIQVFERVK